MSEIERLKHISDFKRRYSNVISWLSIEPLIGPLDFKVSTKMWEDFKLMDWIAVGGESGNDSGKHRYRTADLDWFKDIVSMGQEAKTPVFVRQLGRGLARNLRLRDGWGRKVEEWPEELRVREFPEEPTEPQGLFF